VYTGDPTAQENATIYAIDLSSGTTKWKFDTANRYQGSAIVVSGGLVYAVDRGGILHALDEQTGSELRSWTLGGVGAAGVALGEDIHGRMLLFAPAGGESI